MRRRRDPLTGALQIRPARQEDWPGWQRLWADYHAYGQANATSLPDAVTGMTWERFFEAYEPMEALVAELEGRLVGFAHMVFHHSTSAIAPSCLLNDLFVESALHGRGIGRALVEAVYARAQKAGARRVYWHVLEANATAVRLYERVASRSGHVVFRKDFDALPR